VKRLSAIVIGSLVAAVIGACGGDDGGTATVTETAPARPESSSPSSGQETISKAEYIKRGDAICAKYNQRTEDLQDQKPDTYEEAAELYQHAIDIFKPAVQEFEALPKPKGDEQVLEEYLDAARQQVALYERVQDAAEQKDRGKLETYAQDIRELRAKARGIGKGYGFKVCGREPSS